MSASFSPLLPPLLLLLILLLRVPPSSPLEKPLVPRTVHLNLGSEVLEFDGRSQVPTKFVLTCPIPGAIWIVPFDHRPAERLRKLRVRDASRSSQLVISADRSATSGTYSCCDPRQLPDSHRQTAVHVRSQFHCLEGCCPWYRRGCAVDLAERSCMQLRLLTSMKFMQALSFVENSPMLVPCFLLNNQSVTIYTSDGGSVSNESLIPGYGYCTNILMEQQKSKILLRCNYPEDKKRRFFVSFIKKTLHINNVIIAIVWKKNTFVELPKVIEVPRNFTVELNCHSREESACLLWENETCYSCANKAQITLKKKIVRSERITCQGSPTTEGGQIQRSSISIKMIDAPYLRIELDQKIIPIIQHETAPVVSMRVAFSPPHWQRSVVAIDSRTSTRYYGSCSPELIGTPRCNVSLQRPPVEVQYELVVTLTPPETDGLLDVFLENRSFVSLVPQFNRQPNITGLPRIGMVGQSYEALCVPDSNPTATIRWFLDGQPVGAKNASKLALTATRARRTCVRCEVHHPLLKKVASERCLLRTDVNLKGFDVRLAVATRRPLFRLVLHPKLSDGEEDRLEVVEEAELHVRCLTFLRPSNASLEITLDGVPLRNVTDRWTGFSREVAARMAARNGSLITCWTRPSLQTSPPLRIFVRRHQKPQIAPLPARRRVLDAHELRQVCEASGVPLPWVVWRFGGAAESEGTSLPGPNVSQPGRGASELYIRDVTRDNSGVYICEARGAYATVRQQLQLDVNPRVLDYMTVVTVLVVIFIVLVLCFCSIAYLFHKNWRLRKKLFERYRLLLCSPELGDSSNNYADPFDISLWQLRAQDLRLTRERLGQGEFGRVLKGFLNQPDAPSPVPVAVKQLLSDSRVLGVGRSAEEESMNRRKFMEEIQIMSTVGKHANVLQMLGLVIDEETLQISLVCEFCEGGNLVHYLQARQASFVMRPGPGCDPGALCFEDLLRIAFDISLGMAHIHSRGILHRDLAARNVLVGADGTAKISDFGLSRNRSEYSGLEYSRRNTNERLPWKWLALECLRDGLFSAKSDVWSYGITLWEIFSLGNRPYPEQYYTTYFIRNLNSGYRLSRPAYASDSIFEVMKSCWLTEQDLRPSFPQIVATVQSVIDRWRAEGAVANARGWSEKRGTPLSNGSAGKALVAQYVNVVGSPIPPASSEECEIKLLDAYVPMSEGSAYTTYSHVF